MSTATASPGTAGWAILVAMHRLLFAILLSLPACGFAAGPGLGPLDRFALSAGTFFSDLSLEGNVSAEGTIDGELQQFAEDFRIGQRRRVEVFELGWSPWLRHEFGLSYHHDVARRGIRLSDEFELDGEVFPIDVDLTSHLRFTSVTLDYTYWAFVDERSALGLQVGVQKLTAGLGLRGRVASGERAEVIVDASVSDHLYSPLFGITGRHVFGEHVRGFIELRALELSYRGLGGRALSGLVGIEVFPWRHWGLVAQYGDTRIRASDSGDVLDGRLELGLAGPQLLLRYRY